MRGDLRVPPARGSFVSLLLWERHSLTYVAEHAGHRVATLANHYAGVLKELDDEQPDPRRRRHQGGRRRKEVCAECACMTGSR